MWERVIHFPKINFQIHDQSREALQADVGGHI